MTEIEDELFLMTNLWPETTGLPMVIWVGPSYGAPHDARIKVMQAHGTRMDPGDLAVVAVMEHWNGLTDGVQLGRQLLWLSPPVPP